jgi:hypothetical protein
MEILITGGAFLGALLGRSFKVLILVPASAVLIALLLMKAGFAGNPLLNSLVKIALLIASLFPRQCKVFAGLGHGYTAHKIIVDPPN